MSQETREADSSSQRASAHRGLLHDVGSLRALFLAERDRRQTIRGQLSQPISVITFASFGYVSLGAALDFTTIHSVTYVIFGLWGFSFATIVLAVILLALVEYQYMTLDLSDFEDRETEMEEGEYFRECYQDLREANRRAEKLRGSALLLLLLSITAFLAAILLLPWDMAY